MESVTVEGLRITYRRAGSGPPLVLLHGAYEDSRVWEDQLEELSDEFTVVAWDTPGCGGSDDLALSAGSLGELLAGFLGVTGLAGRRPHVLGLSFGSVVALDLWRTHPEIPRTLILASAYAGWAGSLPPEEVERRYRQATAELEKPPSEIIPAWLPTLLTPRATDAMRAKVARLFEDFRPAGMRALLAAAGRADYRPVLPTITVPTLLLYGSEDVRSPVAVGEELHRQITGSELMVLPDVGHMSFVEAPEAFNGAVRRWLRVHNVVSV
ncbi:alpha/beta hydrolase [Sinomonas sp. JGH33]|uniref:Alpha/beta hydrolase n=1 Tax=Sinomonas terricola TaxID=3110330 RepID=A0ABU5T5P2_9MICC|nr:alpha/beta hydrolase [Sinomonas sp. JGH33]MEA5454995.1 alpha/beta hydrolase [Sinomonas sp. JGH33]